MIIQVGCQLLMGHCSPPLVCCEQRQPRAWCNASPLAALLFAECFGVLAVQMPLSWGAPSHRLMRETLANGGPGGLTLGSAELREAVAREWVQGAAVYYDLLSSASTLDIWETEYLQVLAGPDPVLEWVKATGLRPILNGLGDEGTQTISCRIHPALARRLPNAQRRANALPLSPLVYGRHGLSGAITCSSARLSATICPVFARQSAIAANPIPSAQLPTNTYPQVIGGIDPPIRWWILTPPRLTRGAVCLQILLI